MDKYTKLDEVSFKEVVEQAPLEVIYSIDQLEAEIEGYEETKRQCDIGIAERQAKIAAGRVLECVKQDEIVVKEPIKVTEEPIIEKVIIK